MKQYDLVIIGFGKGGKTLAKTAASEGKRVAMIEQSKKMYGGTCINIACIPSKTLIHDSIEGKDFKEAMNRKYDVVHALNNKNYHNLADENNIDVLDYKAQFKSNNEINLFNKEGEVAHTISGENIIINTGSIPVIPDIEGVDTSKNIVDSTGIMELPKQPKKLVIVGGGYIALEFASMFANFGTEVTVLERNENIMPKEDSDVVEYITSDLKDKGIKIVTNTQTNKFEDNEDKTIVHTSQGEFVADIVLLATGRKPNTDLALENTDVELQDSGEIKVNEKLQTTVDKIYALGDVKGGMQFTYISLDDFRIVHDQLYSDKKRTMENRGHVPYTVFIDPPFSRVGMTSEEAKKNNYEIVENSVEVKNIPRHKVNNDSRGVLKATVNKENNEILGVSLYGEKTEELINLVKLAMDQNIKADTLKSNIYTHPTMSESLNDLLDI